MVLHDHKITEIGDLIAFIDETQGAADLVYNGDGTVAKILSYWDAAKTLLLSVETFSYLSSMVLSFIDFDIYNADGTTINQTLRYNFSYNSDDTLAGDVVTQVFP